VHRLLRQAFLLRHVGRYLELRRVVVLDRDLAGLLVDDNPVPTHADLPICACLGLLLGCVERKTAQLSGRDLGAFGATAAPSAGGAAASARQVAPLYQSLNRS
jgi:hypothetical protein